MSPDGLQGSNIVMDGFIFELVESHADAQGYIVLLGTFASSGEISLRYVVKLSTQRKCNMFIFISSLYEHVGVVMY